MRKLLLASVCALALLPTAALAAFTSIQDPTNLGYVLKVNSDGSINIAGTFSASLTGFTPNGNVATLAVSNASANVALPAGNVVAVANTGSVDASIKLSVGAGTAATTDFILKAGATVGLTVGTNTFLNAVTASSTTNLSLAGGSGLVSGYGGNSGTGASGVAQGSPTSGQSVNPMGCRTLAAAPTDTTAQTNMPRCRTDGSISTTVENNGVAQGSATSGATISPVGCRTLSTTPTDTTAQTNIPVCNIRGNLVVSPYTLPDNLVQGTTAAMTGTTSTSLLAAPGANLFNYVTSISCVNSHATVGTFVTVQDGSGGTALWTLAAASVFGGTVVTFPAPLKQPTANTALFVADVTTGANVICSAAGYKGP